MIVLDGRCGKCGDPAPVCASCTLRKGKAICTHCCDYPRPDFRFDCGVK